MNDVKIEQQTRHELEHTLLIFLMRFLLAGRPRLAFEDVIFKEVAEADNWQEIMRAAATYTKYGINYGDFL